MENMEKRMEISDKLKTLLEEISVTGFHGTASILSLAGMSLFISDEALVNILSILEPLADQMMAEFVISQITESMASSDIPDGYADKKSMEN